MDINELSTQQIQELLELARRVRIQEEDDTELPEAIFEDLETTSKTTMEKNLKRFTKDIRSYSGGKWTQSGAINKEFIPELKKRSMDVHTAIQARYKDADKLRQAGRAATEIYEDLQFIISRGIESGDEDTLANILERARRLAVFSFGSGKAIDHDTKETIRKTLRLPAAVRYIDIEDEDDKDLAFSTEAVKEIFDARYQESIERKASGGYRSYGSRPGFNSNRGKPFYRGARKSFFGKHHHNPSRPKEYNTDPDHTTNQ
ncbi:hypothetical protein RO3G_05826 [Lichtheimia corymbifera JMRC:FSU:9682]|uniref:Uncharacterized protein n=1 Tax=Lichtheimia corymbifera JMRC:FSU:9682 TaxID=1263082 RepID=A0A068SGG1_9FUNG|nr:hypothetical protein RO3G_05826 [Lichtheimia corymbifera JMRC:FSU:9682]